MLCRRCYRGPFCDCQGNVRLSSRASAIVRYRTIFKLHMPAFLPEDGPFLCFRRVQFCNMQFSRALLSSVTYLIRC